MKNRELKVHTNEEEIDVSCIPQSVIDGLADLFYGMMLRNFKTHEIVTEANQAS